MMFLLPPLNSETKRSATYYRIKKSRRAVGRRHRDRRSHAVLWRIWQWETHLCYTLSAMLPSQYKDIYIDTVSAFSRVRIESIAKARVWIPQRSFRKIQVPKPLDRARQESCIESACSMSNSEIKLLLLDSMTVHYRVDYAGRSKLPEKQQRLNKYMLKLLRIARTNDEVVVVVTNQMQPNPAGVLAKINASWRLSHATC
jgi:RecA/RadA recombinase